MDFKMKGFPIVLLVFIFGNFEKITTTSGKWKELPHGIEKTFASDESRIDKWLNKKIKIVQEQCDSNEKIDFDRVMKLYDSYIMFNVIKENKKLSNDIYYFDTMYHPKMIKTFKHAIESIQNCLEENDRLKPEELAIVMNKLITTHTNRNIERIPISIEDFDNCFRVCSWETLKCERKYLHLLRSRAFNHQKDQFTILQVLIPSSVSSSSCTEILPLEQCYMKVLRNCSLSVKRNYQVYVTPSEISDGICDIFLNNTDIDSEKVPSYPSTYPYYPDIDNMTFRDKQWINGWYK